MIDKDRTFDIRGFIRCVTRQVHEMPARKLDLGYDRVAYFWTFVSAGFGAWMELAAGH